MRTARTLTVSPSMLGVGCTWSWGGVVCSQGVYLVPGVSTPGGTRFQGGVCSGGVPGPEGGVCSQGVYLVPGVYLVRYSPPLSTDRRL